MHGANRLASNSLLEGLVFSRRIAERLTAGLPERREPVTDPRPAGLLPGDERAGLQQTMTERAGVLRSSDGLRRGAAGLAVLAARRAEVADVRAWETTNLHTVATALLGSALAREETRGSHWREDFPERDDARWSGHLDVTLVDGVPRPSFHESPAVAGAVS